MINIDYPDILNLLIDYNLSGRSESASFLMWYLENYYRLDPQEAIDSVCDESNDMGIDGIYVNEANGTIDIFQSKISQRVGRTQGDKALREFYGSLSQFENKESLQNLTNTARSILLVNLIKSLDLIELLESYTVRGIFISNIELDTNGQAFIDGCDNLEFIGKSGIETTYISKDKGIPSFVEAKFDISSVSVSEYYVDTDTLAIIAPIKALELVQMHGIIDQSIFAYNVRGPLGNTKVNKDIVRSIKNPSYHKQFPLFHNGITIVANEIEKVSDDEIKIKTFFVVNGCQSLTALNDNKSNLTDDLRVLVKFIKVNVTSDLSKTITKFSNNQNGIKARDFKSNNNIQIRLQNQISDIYNSEYFYEIQRGEDVGRAKAISNEQTGIRLMAFDLKEPWNTRRRYQVFDEKYNDLFARPEVDAHRIIMLEIIENIIESNLSNINNPLVARYGMTKYTIMYIIRKILEQDEWGKSVLLNPKHYVHDKTSRPKFEKVIGKLIDDIVIDLNGEIGELGANFDYKSKYRDKDWIEHIAKEIVGNHQKLVSRKRLLPLIEEYNVVNDTLSDN